MNDYSLLVKRLVRSSNYLANGEIIAKAAFRKGFGGLQNGIYLPRGT